MMGCALLYGCLTGRASALLPAALQGTSGAVDLTLRLLCGYLFFCGLMEILKALGWQERLSRFFHPLLQRLMPTLDGREAGQAVTLNLTANLLGLGNAATPMGIEAVRQIERAGEKQPKARHALYMLLILNSTSLQLLPTTVLTLRIAADSVRPGEILLPTLACTLLSSLVGAGAGLICLRREERRHDL